jgi:hypothetical protein
VVFDTWVFNCDRHLFDRTTRRPNYHNVFLTSERSAAGHFRLVVMGHTYCFTCGRNLTPRLADLDRERDIRHCILQYASRQLHDLLSRLSPREALPTRLFAEN